MNLKMGAVENLWKSNMGIASLNCDISNLGGHMMKGYYIHESCMANGRMVIPGVQKKITEQENMLATFFEVKDITLEMKYTEGISKVLKRIPFGPDVFDWNTTIKQIKKPDFLYIRRLLACDRGFYRSLQRLKQIYPNLKILLEVPTYPYDKETYSKIKNISMFPEEVFYRNRLHRVVDRIITYSDDKEIFGIPTISIQNGVDVKNQPIRKEKIDKSEIHMLAVASFQRAHGYERIIKGLSEYYKNGGTRKIVMDMVGSGYELDLYKKMTESLKLQEHVLFWGPKYGDELNSFFDCADIGLAPFGFYKHGIEVSSALKLREYLARGLPVVAGSKQDLFTEETFPYYLEFPNNDSVVEITKIIAFYDRVYHSDETYEMVIQNIRTYAEENVTWKKTMAPIIEFLQTEQN
ncbi:MAG: glycosyltransferase [Oscillospiraceae bacterium]|nr:glycosyltransferase [Oscillospiraceae bacterium]